MSSDIILADYEKLEEIARRFSACSEVAQQIIRRVQRAVDSVRELWIGEASEAFFREMECFIPRLHRLEHALEEAAQTTRQIQALFQQSEEEGAQKFNENGSDKGAPGESLSSAKAPTPGAAPTPSKPLPYTIQPGDTLWDLARRYNTTVDELVRLNNIANPDLIYAGNTLLIPPGRWPRSQACPAKPTCGRQRAARSRGVCRQDRQLFNVASNPRYAKFRDGNPATYDTYCNLFASDVAKSLGAELPIFVHNNSGQIRWLGAYDMTSWLAGSLNNAPGGYSGPQGPQHGWKPVDHGTAAAMANKGYVVVAAGAGHMAVVRPGTPAGAGLGDVRIAQAGERNFNDGRMIDGWGSKLGEARFFVHQPTA